MGNATLEQELVQTEAIREIEFPKSITSRSLCHEFHPLGPRPMQLQAMVTMLSTTGSTVVLSQAKSVEEAHLTRLDKLISPQQSLSRVATLLANLAPKVASLPAVPSLKW